MRISDWSSDVCSSDLDAPSMTGELALEDLSFEIAGTGVESLTTRVELVDLGVPATAPGQVLTVSRVHLPTPLDDVQIGRASCRERVCTYVYISVFAVILKKNNDHTVHINYKPH